MISMSGEGVARKDPEGWMRGGNGYLVSNKQVVVDDFRVGHHDVVQ